MRCAARRGSLIVCVAPRDEAKGVEPIRHVNLHHQQLAGAPRNAAGCLLQVCRGAAVGAWESSSRIS